MIKKKSGTEPCIQDSNQNCILTRSIFFSPSQIKFNGIQEECLVI